MMAAPAVFVAYYAFRLIREKGKRNIKRTVGACAVFGAFYLAAEACSIGDKIVPEPDMLVLELSTLLATLCVIPLYVLVSRVLMKSEGLSPEKGEFISRAIVALVACEIGLVGGELVRAFAPAKEGHPYLKEAPWMGVQVVGPIVIALAFYMIAARIIRSRRPA